MGDCAGDERDGAGGALSLRDAAHRALVACDSRRGCGDGGMVSGDAGLRLVCDHVCELLALLWAVWRGHRDAGVALSELVQRSFGSGAEWSAVSGATGSSCGVGDCRNIRLTPISLEIRALFTAVVRKKTFERAM